MPFVLIRASVHCVRRQYGNRQKIMRPAAGTVQETVYGAGGNDPAIILADAKLDEKQSNV